MEWWMQVNSDGNFILNSTGNANKFLYKDYEVGNLNNLYVLRETVIDTGTLVKILIILLLYVWIVSTIIE